MTAADRNEWRNSVDILVPRGRDPFGQHRGSRSAVLTKRIAASGNENALWRPYVPPGAQKIGNR